MKIFLTFLLLIISVLVNGQSVKDEKLSETQIDQLFKVGKVWGYLKYYHPAVARGKYDWDNELLERIPDILSSGSSAKTNQLLFDWVKSLGQTPKQVEYIITEKVKLHPPIEWIEDDAWLGSSLSAGLISLKNAKRSKKSQYVKLEKSGGYTPNELVYPELSFENKGLLLISLFRYWNIIEYYYPYRYLTNDWDMVLRNYISSFYSVTGSLEYKLLINELSTEINDSHGVVYDDELSTYFGEYIPVIDVRKIEGQYVVYKLLPGFDHRHALKKGEIISKIENVPIQDLVSTYSKYIPASNSVIEEYGSIIMALRTNNSLINITVIDGRTLELPTYKIGAVNRYQLQVESSKLIDNNIGYIYPGSVPYDSIGAIFDNFSNTKGLIFDLRCYPAYFMLDFFKYISPNFDEFLLSSNGSIQQPGLFTFDPKIGKVIANPDYYKQRIFVLVDELTFSQSESYAMALKVNTKTTIIGSTTAGADGDAVLIVLPGNVNTTITSWGAYYPDGTETQGIGIVPDIYVRPTIKGLKEGKDELMEYAIELIINRN